MITIECFEGLPLEHESFLIEKYDSFMTTCRYLEIYHSTCDIKYVLIYENSILLDLFIFENVGNTTTCFNSLVEIDQNIVLKFLEYIFDNFPFIQKIKIIASYKEYSFKNTVLFSKWNDHIIDLPASMNDYFLELGYHTRKNMKNRRVRLLRDYPNANFVVKFKTEIDAEIIDKILELSNERMKHKGIVFGKDKIAKMNTYKYSQYYGCVTYVEIEGMIAAGSISTMLNKRIFAHVIAHDESFSKYNLGETCMGYLIQTSIDKGMTSFNLSWGENEYKSRLLAKPHMLFSYNIYRAYSLDYLLSEIKSICSEIIKGFRLSKYSLPIRNAIKSYRIKKWNK